MKQLIGFLFILLLAFSSTAVYADWPFGSYFSQYARHAQVIGKPIFYSQCVVREAHGMRRATVIFQVGQSEGLFLYSGDHSVVNLTTLKWNGKDWKIGDLLGGVYTINKMYNLIQELLGGQFKMLSADHLTSIFGMQPSTTCKEEM